MSRTCRVLLLDPIDPLNPRSGGAQEHICQVFGRLVGQGFDVTWLASSFPGSLRQERIAGLTVQRLGPIPTYFPRAAWTCARETRRGRFDLVVECLNKIPFYSPVYAAVPVLALCHHLFGEVAFQQVSWPAAAVVWTSERGIPWFYRRRPFVAISPSCRCDLIKRGLEGKNIRVIHCGVDSPDLVVDVERPRRRRVTYLGRLEPYKQVHVLLQAMALLTKRFPNAELLIIGRGSAKPRLESLARKLGIAHCTRFAGFLPRPERDALLAETRVCVCPSLKEGWGLVVLEANAVATPVVATDAPGLRDSVQDGETGFLVPAGDVEGFARSIASLLEDDELACSMSRRALAWSARFDWGRASRRMAEALKAAADGRYEIDLAEEYEETLDELRP